MDSNVFKINNQWGQDQYLLNESKIHSENIGEYWKTLETLFCCVLMKVLNKAWPEINL